MQSEAGELGFGMGAMGKDFYNVMEDNDATEGFKESLRNLAAVQSN